MASTFCSSHISGTPGAGVGLVCGVGVASSMSGFPVEIKRHILLDVLLCSVAENFCSLFVF